MGRINLFVGTEKGAFILSSDEARDAWDVRGPLLKGWKVQELQLDARQEPPVLWAAVSHFIYGPSIRRSSDLGDTWEEIEHGPHYAVDAPGKLRAIWTVTPGRPAEPEVLYAGVADAGLFVSKDGGEHWEELKGLSEHDTRDGWSPGAGGLCCHTILLDPANRNRMWAGISAVGVFRSDDRGQTWTTRNHGLEQVLEDKSHSDIGFCIHRMVMDPDDPMRLFQQNHRGVFRSADGGDSWERIEQGLPSASQFGFPMVMSPSDGNTLFIVPQESDEYRFAPDGQLTVFRTTDAGDSWEPQRNGLPENTYVGVLRQAMAVDSCEDFGIYFGTSAGNIFYSRDNGESWQMMPVQLPRIYGISSATI